MQTTRKFVVCLTLLLMSCIRPGACPVPPPLPLRELTVASELIVKAKVGNVSITETAVPLFGGIRLNAGETPTRTVRQARAELHISQVIKGSYPSTLAVVQLWPDDLKDIAQDQEVLFFLEPARDDGHYELAGNLSEGLKIQPTKNLDVYVARIGELLNILAMPDEMARNLQLTEWLVQCVEHPVTRRDGLNDLLDQHYTARWQREEAEEEKEAQSADGDSQETPTATNAPEPAEPETPETNLVALLNESQKHKLLQMLYRSARIGEDELLLIELASEWGDADFIPFLWSYLKANKPDDTYITSTLMTRLAKLHTHNETLPQLIEQYDEAVNGVSEDEEENGQAAKTPPAPADSQALRAEFIKLIESLGPPRLVYVSAETR